MKKYIEQLRNIADTIEKQQDDVIEITKKEAQLLIKSISCHIVQERKKNWGNIYDGKNTPITEDLVGLRNKLDHQIYEVNRIRK